MKQDKNIPIILVGGYLGWDKNNLLGYKYWGGSNDWEQKFREMGYDVYVAELGPFSGLYDKACLLYTIIKGGKVEYGKEHSDTYKHKAFGKEYPGLVPNWGKG